VGPHFSSKRIVSSIWVLLIAAPSLQAAAPSDPLASVLAHVPPSPAEFSEQQTNSLGTAAEELEQWAAKLPLPQRSPSQILSTIGRQVDVKQRVDKALDETLALRTQFADLPPGETRLARLRLYLRTTSTLIDLSGRLRYLLRDSIDTAAYYLDGYPRDFHRLLDFVSDRRVSVAAQVMAYMLFDPPPGSGAKPYTTNEKYRSLNLIGLTHQYDMLPVVAEFMRQEKNPSLAVIAAELIRRLGLPQRPRSGRDPSLPKPPIQAHEVYNILARVNVRSLPQHLIDIRRDLMVWLRQRHERGIVEDSLRLGRMELRPGDWLLMRNPSPYNQFTDVAPGLFTHVGVVAVEEGDDGIRRFVVVDLPERGARIPAATVDTYLMQTLSYVFLRHEDSEACSAMGQAAADMIGNESQFDLKFDTSRVLELKGTPLADARIHTYCAGFLLVCALQTSAPREEFFPIRESVPGGNTAGNLGRLGLSIGEDFISPTGALFSPRLEIVGRREPMYDPGRAVQEAVFDHFAYCMMHKTLKRSPNVFQATRETLAELAEDIPWLARALAEVNDVSQEMDLVAAAKTASVIETLDAIAEENLNGYAEAQASVMAGAMSGENAKKYRAEQIQRIKGYQERHANLTAQFNDGKLTPRQVRSELVRFYADRGRRQLDERFFAGTE
jgi:hypothetical protein